MSDEPDVAGGADEPDVARAADEPSPQWHRRAVIVAVAVLLVFTGWLGWRDVEVRRAEQQRDAMVQAGRAGLLALTTIDHQRVDDDVQRILDASTGEFHDDFAARAESFKDAARTAQSISVGTVTEAGIESVNGDRGSVLVALTVMTSNRGAPEKQPKAWRTRVTVTKDSGTFKVESVEFVP